MKNQLVVFTLAGERYGVSIATVESIITLQPITYVPRAPAFVEGVTNLRGKILPVLDLRKRLGLAVAEPTKQTRIIVATIDETQVGMIVDAVSQVLRIDEAMIQPPSPLVSTVDSTFITGIAQLDKLLIIVLDLEKVLLPEEKEDLQGALLHESELLVPSS